MYVNWKLKGCAMCIALGTHVKNLAVTCLKGLRLHECERPTLRILKLSGGWRECAAQAVSTAARLSEGPAMTRSPGQTQPCNNES